jgi:xanthine/CO dehydrogenase XdhC/CoxF family maturation factor
MPPGNLLPTIRMNHSGSSLDDFFAQALARGQKLVLATVVETLGSTYRKAGAQMLVSRDGSAAGLLSGGCLEADLLERANSVFAIGEPKIIEYDARDNDDLIWGIGLGCEGAMKILLTRLDASNDYQPFRYIAQCRNQERRAAVAVSIAANDAAWPLGTWVIDADHAPERLQASLANPPPQAIALREGPGAFLVLPIPLPRRLLVLGAGPDAMPLVEMAALLGWHVTVSDHRPTYARTDKFPQARAVLQRPAAELALLLQERSFDAAVVMSHHLISDELYLRQLSGSSIPYIGLLGPARRRARLSGQLGDCARLLSDRLHGPIGLDLGADSPETIALAIVSEIQAVLAGRSGSSFSKRQNV